MKRHQNHSNTYRWNTKTIQNPYQNPTKNSTKHSAKEQYDIINTQEITLETPRNHSRNSRNHPRTPKKNHSRNSRNHPRKHSENKPIHQPTHPFSLHLSPWGLLLGGLYAHLSWHLGERGKETWMVCLVWFDLFLFGWFLSLFIKKSFVYSIFLWFFSQVTFASAKELQFPSSSSMPQNISISRWTSHLSL